MQRELIRNRSPNRQRLQLLLFCSSPARRSSHSSRTGGAGFPAATRSPVRWPAQYPGRWRFSLPCSEWERVGPLRHGHRERARTLKAAQRWVVAWGRRGSRPRPSRTGSLRRLPAVHVRPMSGSSVPGSYPAPEGAGGRSPLGVGFALRCLQRLSRPHVAVQPCPGRDSWDTSGASVPVLSYWGRLPADLLRPRQIGTELSHDVLNPAHVPL